MSRFAPTRWVRTVAALIALAISLPLGVSHVQAADALKDGTSLKFAPADVSFYISFSRTGEVFDKFANSNAIAKLKSIPAVQFGLAMAMMQWENPQNPQLAALKQQLADPANQELVELLKDAMSHEAFVYGDSNVGKVFALINEINQATSEAQLEAMSSGDFGEMESIQTRKIIEVLGKNVDDLTVPTLVKGMKLSDTKRAVGQLQRLEGLVQGLLAQQPALQPRFSREKIGGAEYLTLRLDGSLVPWPFLQNEVEGVDPQEVAKVTEKLQAMTLVVSMGVREDYLLVSIGADNKHLAALGQGKLLYDRDEFAPIRQAADKPMMAVSFASAEFAKQVGSIDGQIDQLVGMVKQFAPMLLATAPELQQELVSDVESFGEYIKKMMPESAASSGFAFLTPQGMESYSYSWTTETGLDGSQELGILQHVGGDPVMFYAGRGKSDPAQFEALMTFTKRLAYYIEQYAMQDMDEDQQASYDQLKSELAPLLTKLEETTRSKLVPAFADGQSAIVVDAKSKSQSWIAVMPPSEEELPMLEIAMVLGVSDQNLVKEGFGEYFTTLQQILDKLHEASTGEASSLFPNEVPPVKLAKPRTKDVGSGTVYYYSLPEESGVDAQLAPNAGLSDKVMVTSLFPQFTARLLQDTPVADHGPLASHNGPLGAAYQLRFATLLDAIGPWINYGIGVSMSVSLEAQPNPMGDVGQQINDVLDVLKCFRGVAGVTYVEDKATVSHAQWNFEDLK